MKVVTLQEKGSSYSVTLSHGIQEVADQWTAQSGNLLYAQTDYLSLLETNGPKDYGYVYAIISHDDKVLSACYFQHKTIRLAEDFRIHTHKDSILARWRVAFLKRAFKFIKHNILVSGNVLLTGEYAYSNSTTNVSELYPKVLDHVCDYLKNEKKIKVKSILAKDFYVDSPMKRISFYGDKFTQIEVQPDMVLPNDEKWKSYDDYLGAVRSKYRVKFKKVKKKGSGLVIRLLSEEEAARYNVDMYALYKATADRATFSLFILDEDYFALIKKNIWRQTFFIWRISAR